jgi:dienelactone hydrolase
VLVTSPQALASKTERLPRVGRWTRDRLLDTALVVVAVGGAFLVGRDGTLLWQLIRVVVVAALSWFVYVIVDRGTPRQRGGVAFAIGCVSVAVGTGIGVPYLAKAGVTPTTVAGLAVLAGGLVMLGSGGVALVRITSRWWRLLVLPALLVAFAVALWTLGQAVAATNVPPTSVGSATPADRGMSYRDVEFQTTDGVTLSGWYVPSTDGAAVVLMHGAGSTRSGVLDQAEVLADHGFGVLLFDARGHGRSEGRAMDFGWYGDADASAAVSFLQRQPDVDDERIAAMGMSMGGEQAIGAAAADPRIRAVVAEGATNRVAGDKAWLSEVFGWRGAVQERVDWLTYGITDVLTDADQPITLRDAAAVARRPMLLIAGAAVENEPYAGRYIESGSPATIQLWVAPETGHTAALDTHPDEWERRVTTFLAAALHAG